MRGQERGRCLNFSHQVTGFRVFGQMGLDFGPISRAQLVEGVGRQAKIAQVEGQASVLPFRYQDTVSVDRPSASRVGSSSSLREAASRRWSNSAR